MQQSSTDIVARYGSPERLCVLVAHGTPLVSIGLASALRRSTGWDVKVLDRDSRGDLGWPNVAGFNVVIGDEAHALTLLDVGHATSTAAAGARPKLVVVTPPDGVPDARLIVGSSVDRCISVRCEERELVTALRRLCGAADTNDGVSQEQVSRCGGAQPARESEVPSRAARPSRGAPAAADRTALQPSRPRGGLAPSALRRVLEHMRRHVAEPVTPATLAAVAGLSVCHFSRAFRESVGLPPHRYLMRVRVMVACDMIRNTDRPLADISLEAGLSDQSHLTRLFVRMVGERPSDFRRHYR